jgi:hypothetical protein
MKLSVSYNFFNGEEHLIASVNSIRASVDFISIVYQSISNSGNIISPEALDTLSDIRNRKLADSIIEFTPDFSEARQQNELAKRRIGLDEALRHRCTHFFTMDADEFYRQSEIEFAKDYVSKNRIWATSVSSFFHIKTPNWRAKDTTCCAFITRINERTEIGVGSYYIDMVDPTRSLKTPDRGSLLQTKLRALFPRMDHHHFADSDVAMYHMNFVRKDAMKSKLANTSTTDTAFLEEVRNRYQNWEPGKVFHFPNKGKFTFEKVDNEFNAWTP